jgi:molybdopterin/thiamine biosynthesis adenylyltransferase
MRSAAMTEHTHEVLSRHLLQHLNDEDLSFAIYHPSTGVQRTTAVVSEPILPLEGEREVHGNVEFTGEYFLRAAGIAAERGAGVAFLHSHTRRSRGWQEMSGDDIDAETAYAPRALAITGLPLVGMTLAGDGAWSARFWEKTAPKAYKRVDCESVRVVGGRLRMTYNEAQRPAPGFREALTRTISAWGAETQADLARLRIGVVGVGNVGAIIAEALARTGVQHVRLLDFDTVKTINLDRILHATERDVRMARSKVEMLARALRRSATAAEPIIEPMELSVVEEDGFRAALDCDVLFSCVDRPWPRSVLNFIAFAHLIPVVDGGIRVQTTGDKIVSADWKAHVAAPERRCLECLGQYDPNLVTAERFGQLDDPHYLDGLPAGHPILANENVFAFGLGAGSLEALQLLLMVAAPGGISDVGAQNYHFKTGAIDLETRDCEPHCLYSNEYLGLGDDADLTVTGRHEAAERERVERAANQSSPRVRLARTIDQLLRRLELRLDRHMFRVH